MMKMKMKMLSPSQMVLFASDVLLAIGGYSMLSTAEVPSIPSVSPTTSCPSFDLPEPRQSHVAFNTHDKKVLTSAHATSLLDMSCLDMLTSTYNLIQALVCGGKTTLRSCLEFEQEIYEWQTHSTLREERYFHSVVVMPAGTYILGGYSNRFTSEFLPTGSTEWQAGPAIPSPGLAYGCAVAIDSTRFVVAGGKVFSPKDAVANVRVYDTASDAWIQFGKSLKPKKNFGRNWQDGLIEWLIPSVYLSTFMTSLDSTFLLFFGEALTPATALILTNMLQIFPEFHDQNFRL